MRTAGVLLLLLGCSLASGCASVGSGPLSTVLGFRGVPPQSEPPLADTSVPKSPFDEPPVLDEAPAAQNGPTR